MEPVAGRGYNRTPVVEVGLAAIPYKKQVAEHRHALSLLALTQESGNRKAKELAEKIK